VHSLNIYLHIACHVINVCIGLIVMQFTYLREEMLLNFMVFCSSLCL
jgi:hypothetical protein